MRPARRKGSRSRFRRPDGGIVGGDAAERGDGGRGPGRSYLFFLTALRALEPARPEIGPRGRKSPAPASRVRRAPDVP